MWKGICEGGGGVSISGGGKRWTWANKGRRVAEEPYATTERFGMMEWTRVGSVSRGV